MRIMEQMNDAKSTLILYGAATRCMRLTDSAKNSCVDKVIRGVSGESILIRCFTEQMDHIGPDPPPVESMGVLLLIFNETRIRAIGNRSSRRCME